ncbi:MAG: hypothetical protein ABSG25_01250 [Bryobacteraceae bacterium]
MELNDKSKIDARAFQKLLWKLAETMAQKVKIPLQLAALKRARCSPIFEDTTGAAISALPCSVP